MTNDEQQILINRDGNQFGPYSLPEAKTFFLSGHIVLTDTAKVEGGEWLPVSDVLGMAPPPPKPTSHPPKPTSLSPAPLPSEPQPAKAPVGISYLMAVIVPFVGVIMGIYILTKGRIGHAIAVIILSLCMMSFWLGFWTSFSNAISGQ